MSKLIASSMIESRVWLVTDVLKFLVEKDLLLIRDM